MGERVEQGTYGGGGSSGGGSGSREVWENKISGTLTKRGFGEGGEV